MTQLILTGGQCTTDRHCPTKTLSARGDLEFDQLHVPANHLIHFTGNGKRPSQEPQAWILFFARLLQSEIFFGIISNFIYKVFLRTWQRAKPRTLTGQLFILGTLWICFCSLFYVFGTYGQVFAHDLNYWNFIIKVEYSYMEIYLTSLIWFNCMFTGFSSQRITPMIQFCSSVISMVAPSWCHGPS